MDREEFIATLKECADKVNQELGSVWEVTGKVSFNEQMKTFETAIRQGDDKSYLHDLVLSLIIAACIQKAIESTEIY